MTTTQLTPSMTQRRTLARITGVAGIATLVVVLGTSLANDYQSASFNSDANEAVMFFRSLDDRFGAFSSFADRGRADRDALVHARLRAAAAAGTTASCPGGRRSLPAPGS